MLEYFTFRQRRGDIFVLVFSGKCLSVFVSIQFYLFSFHNNSHLSSIRKKRGTEGNRTERQTMGERARVTIDNDN